jgi:hypothetical protein
MSRSSQFSQELPQAPSRFWIDAPTHLASLLGKPQAEISKIENRADMLMSTLRNFVQAMGGDFEVKAVFTDCAIEISTFSLVARKPKPAKPRKSLLQRINVRLMSLSISSRCSGSVGERSNSGIKCS